MTQGKYWLITDYDTTINYDTASESFWNSKNIVYSKGQLEQCPLTDREHWQFTVCYAQKVRPATVKTTLGNAVHCEVTTSKKTLDYVWKDETSLGRRWEHGRLPFKRNSKPDWDKIKQAAKEGRLDDDSIPSSVFVCNYASLKKIKMDYMKGEALEKEVNVFWGNTGLGKSRRAWFEAGMDAYPKAPTTKFWDGYQGESSVVFDEFTGQIEISHMLRWLDRYPVLVEQKGSGTPLKATKIWITSNTDPASWYPSAPGSQRDALLRRLKITEFVNPWTPPAPECLPEETSVTYLNSMNEEDLHLLVDQPSSTQNVINLISE